MYHTIGGVVVIVVVVAVAVAVVVVVVVAGFLFCNCIGPRRMFSMGLALLRFRQFCVWGP